jgi:hypothetical protein
MNQKDIFYRAFAEYRKQTSDNAKCKKFRGSIRQAGAELDQLEAIRSNCIIEEDWVNRIYEGLPFIEKAIREERQFIRQEGEVVPIEKAKRVSKDTVEHLARHSDMITHVPEEGNDLTPDKLYIVEKLSDFAVYENRFLYMLLCYLRDFIEIRYGKIVELGNTYRANFSMKKEIRLNKRQISFQTVFSEEAKNDPASHEETAFTGLMQKIEEERHIIAALLLTPLMKDVSHSPMLKPPITRTNALRMNNNFKNALALYDYISAYNKDGFRIETVKKVYNPFSDEMGDEFAELVALTSFLVYEYGKDIKKPLQKAYELEEQKRKQEHEQRQKMLLEDLRRRVAETGEGMEEYLLLLEKRNQKLEAGEELLRRANEEIEALGENIRVLKLREDALIEQTDALRQESAAKDEQMRIEREAKEEEIRLQQEAHAQELLAQKQEAQNEKLAMETQYKDSMQAQQSGYEERLGQKQSEIEAQQEENRKLSEERTLLKAELHANKKINGSIVEEGDFSSKARFEELEREYEALGSLLKKEWGKTKKKIRNRVLWNKIDEDESNS